MEGEDVNRRRRGGRKATQRGSIDSAASSTLPSASSAVPVIFFLAAAVGCDPGEAARGPARVRPYPVEAKRLEGTGDWSKAAEVHAAEAWHLGPGAGDEPAKWAFVDFLTGGDLAGAEKLALGLRGRYPSWNEVLYYLGDGQRVVMRFDEARSTLARLCEMEPKHSRGRLALGHVLLRLGEPETAIEHIEAALSGPGMHANLRWQAELDRARALRLLGRSREAFDRLAEMLERRPHDPLALSEAAQTAHALRQAELARGLREAHGWLVARGHQLSTEDETKLYPEEGSAAGSGARKALQAADRREFLAAIEGLESALAAAPGDEPIAAALARLYLRLSRFHDALRIAEAFATGEKAPGADILRLAGDAHRSLGRSREAEAAFRRALEREPGGWRRIIEDGRAAIDGKRYAEALKKAEEARVLAGEVHPEIERLIAEALGLSGDLRSAAARLMDLIRRQSDDPENFASFERVFGGKKESPEVAQVLEMKRALDERLARRDVLARSYSAKPLAASGEDSLILGSFFRDLGKREEALDQFLLAGALLPTNAEPLRRAAALFDRPSELFVRLHLLRVILERTNGADANALKGLAGAYIAKGMRLAEAERLAKKLAQTEPGGDAAKMLAEIEGRKGDR